VELVRLYSNGQSATNRLIAAHRSALSAQRGLPDPLPRPPQRISRRLGPDVIEQILADYQAGIACTALGRQYGIGKTTVVRLLRRHGVVVRRQAMTSAEQAEAIRLYQLGWPLAKIGNELDRPMHTVRNVLIRRGIARRSAQYRSAKS
jgi:hypothetical protein